MLSRRILVLASVAASSLALSAYAWQHRAPQVPAAGAVGAPADDHTAHMQATDLMPDMPSPANADAGQPGDPRLPASNGQAAARLAASPRHGEWVKIPTAAGGRDSIMAWIVYPTSRTKAPVVVVVHEIFGLSPWVRAVADQAAAEGFIAISPDFLSRVRGGPTSVDINPDTARRLIAGVDAAERNRIIAAAANYAMMQPAAEQKYAVIGYCWGGTTTWMHTINGGLKGFAGGVAFYGLPYMSGGTPATATTAAVPARVDADSLAKIKAPIMLLNGTNDARIAAAMPALDSIMVALGKQYVGVNYPGAAHGFLRAQGEPKPDPRRDQAEEAANISATREAWPVTVAFLKKQMGVK